MKKILLQGLNPTTTEAGVRFWLSRYWHDGALVTAYLLMH
jgi:hypothetical protein